MDQAAKREQTRFWIGALGEKGKEAGNFKICGSLELWGDGAGKTGFVVKM